MQMQMQSAGVMDSSPLPLSLPFGIGSRDLEIVIQWENSIGEDCGGVDIDCWDSDGLFLGFRGLGTKF